MPIDNEHQAVYPINGNPQIQRYMSLEKFISLISKNTMFFTRLDKLEDPFEGTVPNISKVLYTKWYEQMKKLNHFTEVTDEKIENNYEQHLQLAEKFRALNCVNCWHIRDVENALMWRSYAAQSSGIMIKSNYQRIVKSFEKTSQSLQSSLVSYRDYESDITMPIGNMTYLTIHKTKFYEDEKELRLFHTVPDNMWVHDWDNEESNFGVNITANIDILIEEIRLAPFTPNWYFDVVKSICEIFGLNKPVLRSSLEK